MLLSLLLACETEEEAPEPVEASEPEAMNIEVLPAEIAFGVVGIGLPVTQVLSVYNHGDTAVQIASVAASAEGLTLQTSLDFPILSGAIEPVTVIWTPLSPSDLIDTLHILVSSATGELREVPVPLVGTASGPVIALSVDRADFGTVSVGCEGEQSVTITNVGTGSLVVDAITLVEQSDITLLGPDGELAPLPWTLTATESRVVRLLYAPLDERGVFDVLRVTSDDPASPSVEVEVVGAGRIEAENSITYAVIREQNVTVLFAMNQVVPVGTFRTRMEDALPVFFDALQAARAPYRVAFLTEQNGEVVGDTLYIDDTMTTDEAMEIYDDMVAIAGGDNDYLLETLANGVEANTAWLLDESDAWAESKLSVIGMNSDTEQSTGNYVVYVTEYQAWKDDADDAVVHAIGGDVPRGCAEAEPFEAFYDAATLSGGAFLSICAADWTTNMETLAAAVRGENQAFALTGEPAAWSIEVWIDGVRATSGWSWDDALRAVVFDDDAYPRVGAEVRIDYLMATDCIDD